MSRTPPPADAPGSAAPESATKTDPQSLSASLSIDNAQLELAALKLPVSEGAPQASTFAPPETSQLHPPPAVSASTMDSPSTELYDPTRAPFLRRYDPAECDLELKDPSPSPKPSPRLPASNGATVSDPPQVDLVHDSRRLLPVGSPEPTMNPEAEEVLLSLVPGIIANLRLAAVNATDLPPMTKDGWPISPDWSPISETPLPDVLSSGSSADPPGTSSHENIVQPVLGYFPVVRTNSEYHEPLHPAAIINQQPDIAYEHQKEAELTNIPTPPTTDDASLDDTKDPSAHQVQVQEQPITTTTAVDVSSEPVSAPTTASESIGSTPVPASSKRKATSTPRATKAPKTTKRAKVEAAPSLPGPPPGAKVTPVPVPHVPHTPSLKPPSTPYLKPESRKRSPPKKKRETTAKKDKGSQKPRASAAPAVEPGSEATIPSHHLQGQNHNEIVRGELSNVVGQAVHHEESSRSKQPESLDEMIRKEVNDIVDGAVQHEQAAAASDANSSRPSRIKKRKAPFEEAVSKAQPAKKKPAGKESKASKDDSTKATANGEKTTAESKKAQKVRAPRAPKAKSQTPRLPLPQMNGGFATSPGNSDTPGLVAAPSATSTMPSHAGTSSNSSQLAVAPTQVASTSSNVSRLPFVSNPTSFAVVPPLELYHASAPTSFGPNELISFSHQDSLVSGDRSFGLFGPQPPQPTLSSYVRDLSNFSVDSGLQPVHGMGTDPQSATTQTSSLFQTNPQSTGVPDWSRPQPSPPGGYKPQQKSGPMPPPPEKKTTKATGSRAKAASGTSKAKAPMTGPLPEANSVSLVNGTHHAEEAAAANALHMMSAPVPASHFSLLKLVNGNHLPSDVATQSSTMTGPTPSHTFTGPAAPKPKAPAKPRKQAAKSGTSDPKPALNFQRDNLYRLDMITQLHARLNSIDGINGGSKTHGAVTDSVILKLLQMAQHPNTDEKKGPVEVHCMSGTEAYAAMESGWPTMPIVTENQQGFKWASTKRPIEEIFERMEDLERSVSVQIPTRDCTHDSFESRGLNDVRDRFLAKQETNEPWNILDLRSPMPATILPHFLNGRNSQLLLRLRDAVLMPDRAERGTAGIDQWNEWRDVLEWVLLSEGGHNTSPHTDSHGLATWITVQEGQFGFGFLSHPTPEEREKWTLDPHNFHGGRWRFVILDPGQTVFFNSGTIHFVFRLKSEQTLALGGHILQWSGIEQWIQVISSQMKHPHITNEDMEWSAPKYVRMVGELVEKKIKASSVAELGGEEKAKELLQMIAKFDEVFVEPLRKKAKSKSKSKKKKSR